MTKGPSLQDPFLNSLRQRKDSVSIYLVNGIKLQGVIESFRPICRSVKEHSESNGLQAMLFQPSCLHVM